MKSAIGYLVLAVLVFLSVICPGLAAAFPEATPGLLHAMLLKGVQVDPQTGAFRLDQLQALYLPEPPQGSYSHLSDDPARKLWATLSQVGGTELARFDFDAEKMKPPLWLLPYSSITIGGQRADGQTIKLAAGDYMLDFFLTAGKFYSFPFTVKQVGDKLLTMGDWNSWGYFLYGNDDPENQFVWKLFLRRHETGNRDGIAPRTEIVRDADKKLIATGRPDFKLWLNDKWTRYDLEFVYPPQSPTPGGFLPAKAILSQDGAYTLKIAMDGAPYGSWPFKIAGGRLVLAGRADRETADPLTFIGGGGAYWYQSQSAVMVDAGQMAAQERTFTQKGFIPDCKTVVVGGTTLVMMCPVVTFLEALSQWNAGAKTLSITHGDKSIRLTLGNATAQTGAGPVALGVAPLMKEGDFYAPLKPVAQALGAEVQWDAKMRLLMVIDGDRCGLIHVP